MPNRQGLHQPVGHRLQHRIQIGIRVQLAREFNQCAPVIVPVAIEVTIQPLLYPVPDRLKQECRNEHHDHQTRVAHILEADSHHLAHSQYDRVKRGQHAQRRQRIGIAAAEDRVHIHQPVAHNRVRDGQRNQRQRQHRIIQIRAERHAQNIRRRIQNHERRKTEQHSVAQPLQLLPDDRVFRLHIPGLQDDSA